MHQAAPPSSLPTKRCSVAQVLFTLVVLGGVVCALLLVLSRNDIGTSVGDVLPYWAAAKIFVNGGNPYDQSQLAAEVRAQVPSVDEVMSVYAPPPVFSVFCYAGFVPFTVFTKLWLLLSLGLVLTSVSLILAAVRGDLKLQEGTLVPIATFLLTFYPLLQTLKLGQLSPIMLFSFTLFFWLATRAGGCTQTFLGGGALAVSIFKPHLLFLVYAFLGLESLRQRAFRTLNGFLLGSLLVVALPLLFNPQIYVQYFEQQNVLPPHWMNPSLGTWLLIIFGDYGWLRYLPLAIALLLAVANLPKLWLVGQPTSIRLAWVSTLGLIVTPYLWTYDFLLLLPAGLLLIALGENFRIKSSNLTRILLIAANVAMMLGPREMYYNLWYSLLFLVLLFLLAPRSTWTSR